MTLDNIVRINAYVTGREHLKPYMAVRDELFSEPAPASTLMIVSGFAREEFTVEIEAIAAGPARRSMMAKSFWWSDFTSRDFDNLDPDKVIAVLPIAATEQHGPHLPVATDHAIMAGMLETVFPLMPADIDMRVLPIQAVGKSNEHIRSPGTLTISATTLIDLWCDLGDSVARAGIRKLVIVNSHGGNEEVMGIVARELRVRHDMMVAKTSWMRFGLPDGLYGDYERKYGIHGGDVETSLMLHFTPAAHPSSWFASPGAKQNCFNPTMTGSRRLPPARDRR
jgi:creatinine amidohydrolase/Fe(II)-dependent formamide hydrolase-like protein